MAPPKDTPPRDDRSATAGVDAAIEALRAENALLRAENAALTARLAELERRRGLNSGNSGKPPSSDGLKKPVRVSSLRGSSGKKSGGQKGHPGETLCQVETPDATIEHYPEACAACGEALTAAMASGHVARQVFDLPEPRPLIVTEHRAHRCRCAACGPQTRARARARVEVVYNRLSRIIGDPTCSVSPKTWLKTSGSMPPPPSVVNSTPSSRGGTLPTRSCFGGMARRRRQNRRTRSDPAMPDGETGHWRVECRNWRPG